MTHTSTIPARLDGCSVLPPMEPQTPQATNPAKMKPHRAPKTKGRFAEFNAFADVTLRHLDRAEIAVWSLLWRDTKPNGLARTSQADLARRAGINPRTVGRALRSLERRGLLTIVYRGGLRRGLSTYRVHPLIRPPP